MSGTKKKRGSSFRTFFIPILVGVTLLGAVGFLVRIFLSDDKPRSKEQLTSITLLKPPPDIKEKPPEPQIQKEIPKETMVAPDSVQQDSPDQAQDQSQDNTPAGSDLGVDAEGGAGGDSFGLVGKKGGRAITLGGGGGGAGARMSLLAKYGWYTKKIERELWQQVKAILDKDGGIPKGKHQATIHLVLTGNGNVVRYQVVGSSGSEKIDKALKSALSSMRVSEPPPDGMPGGMTIKVSSQS